MGSGEFTRDERHALVARIKDLFRMVFEPPEDDTADAHVHGKRKEALLAAYAEYGDRLPRVRISTCPFTAEPFLGAFDPWGFDGPWWHKIKIFTIAEPEPPKTFQALLGAVNLNGRVPAEVTEEVIPGPEAPFVVARLLGLPGMVAVLNRLDLDQGEKAYTIAYFSEATIDPADLHQFWLRQDFWFADAEGNSSFLIANDQWDFDLAPWVASGKLKWIRPGDAAGEVVGVESGEECPYIGVAGDQQPQVLIQGERDVLDPPDGTPVDPFNE